MAGNTKKPLTSFINTAKKGHARISSPRAPDEADYFSFNNTQKNPINKVQSKSHMILQLKANKTSKVQNEDELGSDDHEHTPQVESIVMDRTSHLR
jgi:hypothetical protein